MNRNTRSRPPFANLKPPTCTADGALAEETDNPRRSVPRAAFAYLAGLTSTLGALIAGANSQARLLFDAGREGLLPGFIGRVHRTRHTPMNAIFTFITIALLLIGSWGLGRIIGGSTGSMDAVNFFVESSTMGTIRGALTILVPLYYLGKPGQPAPWSWFPWASLAIIVLAFVYAVFLVRRDPSLADRVGSIVADEQAGHGPPGSV